MNKTQKDMTAIWLREGRLSKGLTQKELSERSNISVRSIQRIENGDIVPRSHTLKTLAGILELSLETFLPSLRGQDESSTVNEAQATTASTPKAQRIILSVGVVLIIVFLAWAFAAQSARFPETSFELFLFMAGVLAFITAALLFVWRRKV
jgi:transcriptional regulator with XRE-family HTH domain